jgi:hypothetical protein
LLRGRRRRRPGDDIDDGAEAGDRRGGRGGPADGARNDLEDNPSHPPILQTAADAKLLVEFTRAELALAAELKLAQHVVIYTYPGGVGGPNFSWIRKVLGDAGLHEGPGANWVLYAASPASKPGDANPTTPR